MSFITDRLNGLTSVNCFQVASAELEQILLFTASLHRSHRLIGRGAVNFGLVNIIGAV
jgi:hypothetical protein